MAQFHQELVEVHNPDELNFVLGMSHFIKTAEDIYELLVTTVPHIKFGLAFCEASGPCLVRLEGNDDALVKLAKENALAVGAGHTFFLFVKDGFPISFLNGLKNIQEVCRIFCATANPTQVMVARSDQGAGVMGVIDGYSPKGMESEEDVQARKDLLRKIIGYKK